MQDSYGDPNHFKMDPDAVYEIHIDNNGDSREDLTFQFKFKNTSKEIALNIGGKNVAIRLNNAAAITDVNSAAFNVRET